MPYLSKETKKEIHEALKKFWQNMGLSFQQN